MKVPRDPSSYGFNEMFNCPQRNLAAAVIYNAVIEAEADIESLKWPHHIRIQGCYKREALAFIFSEGLDLWIRAARLPISARALRDKLKPELLKMPRVEELIILNSCETVGRKIIRTKEDFTELEGVDLVK